MMAYNSIISNGSICANGVVIGNGYMSGVARTTGINVKAGDGSAFVIDGKEYKADEVTVRTEYKIKATGKTVYAEPDHLVLKVTGDNAVISVSSQTGNVEIQAEKDCTVKDIKTSTGDVRVSGDVEDIRTMSGNVDVDGSVSGSVTTMSGNISGGDMVRNRNRSRTPKKIKARK